MLLQQLRLQNIRSYKEETITFPEGSSLLSGDIGSGKSTILLAMEFALFGTSRPDLPAEALLRKGAAQGGVELTFLLGTKAITIKRGLKKEKDQIKQMPGYLIINNIKKELMPVELRAEMISLLGYPEDLLAKNKNYIFRYTVYTPQEEMKLILQEEAETRLDTLRKIFNLDKYKIIQENISIYLKSLREKMRSLEAKMDPLEELQKQFQEIQTEKDSLFSSLTEAEVKVSEIRGRLQQQQQELDQLEQQQQEFLQLNQQQKLLTARIQEKEERQLLLLKNQKQLQVDMAAFSLPESLTLEQLELGKKEMEQQKHLIQMRTTLLQERLNHLQPLIKNHGLEKEILSQELTLLPQKENHCRSLIQDIKNKGQMQQKNERLEEHLLNILEIITKNELLLSQSKEIKETMAALKECPVCLQAVPEEHKQQIHLRENDHIRQAESLLLDSKKKKAQIMEEKELLQQDFLSIIKKEHLLTQLETEIKHLREKEEQFVAKEKQLASWIEAEHIHSLELETIKKGRSLEAIEEELAKQFNLMSSLIQKKQLEKTLREVQLQLHNNEGPLAILRQELQLLHEQLHTKRDITSLIAEKKNAISAVVLQEKIITVQLAQIQTKLENTERQRQKLQQNLNYLMECKDKLIHFQKLYHWLEEFFLKVTYTIEKQVMVNIHHLFNQLFKEWFGILIDDETVTSRIDDGFTPLIEQNGYEVAFANLSGGEKTSAALAYRLALNRVINDVIHNIKTKNVLILDEPTDGFSSEQLDKVREVLLRLDLRQTIIVSHESKIESFVENVIQVRKEGHVSLVR